jgi:TolB-like protein/DNA-binding winged helix-turn-helix (wHTH) protein/Flp pilus assembly protein TadD
LKSTQSLGPAERAVNADDLEIKSIRSKDIIVLLSTRNAISHPRVRLLGGILAWFTDHHNQGQYYFLCRFTSSWAREVAPMPAPSIRFEEFELDTESCELRRSGRPIKLERIPMELLILLLQNPGRLVRRETIEQKLWGGNGLLETEHSINTAINKLRATLRDDSRDPHFIRTVVGHGYRFIADVKHAEPIEEPLVPARSPVSFPSPGVAPATTDRNAMGQQTYSQPAVLSNGAGPKQVVTPEPASMPIPGQLPIQAPALEPPQPKANPAAAKKWFIAGSLASLAAILMVVAAVYLLHTPKIVSRPSEPAPGFHSIAVLPFRNLAQNSDHDYLVDGMTDQLISDLAMSTPLRVISCRSVMQYKGVQLPLQEIAKALNVDAIVEGSYLRQGREIRITAQLLDAQNDRHLWAQTYRESDRNLLAMQDQVTNDIAREVALAVGSSFAGLKPRSMNEQARNAYLRGRYLWNERTLSGLTKSIEYYTHAIRADRNYAEAYAALSESYVTLGSYGGPNPTDALWKAQFAAERALQLDSKLSAAHTALAGVKTDRDWDWKGAEEEYRRAIALNPSDSTAHHWYGLHLARLGRGRQGLSELERALSLDPLSLIIATDVAETYYLLREPEQAITRINEVLALNPDFAQAHMVKGKILEELHRYREAEEEFVESGRLFGGGSRLDAVRGHALALAGERKQALRIAQALEAASEQRYTSGVHIAQIYCALRQTETAMKWLDRAYDRHDTGINMLGVDPLFDGCRADSRFQQLLRRIKLNG